MYDEKQPRGCADRREERRIWIQTTILSVRFHVGSHCRKIVPVVAFAETRGVRLGRSAKLTSCISPGDVGAVAGDDTGNMDGALSDAPSGAAGLGRGVVRTGALRPVSAISIPPPGVVTTGAAVVVVAVVPAALSCVKSYFGGARS